MKPIKLITGILIPTKNIIDVKKVVAKNKKKTRIRINNEIKMVEFWYDDKAATKQCSFSLNVLAIIISKQQQVVWPWLHFWCHIFYIYPHLFCFFATTFLHQGCHIAKSPHYPCCHIVSEELGVCSGTYS